MKDKFIQRIEAAREIERFMKKHGITRKALTKHFKLKSSTTIHGWLTFEGIPKKRCPELKIFFYQRTGVKYTLNKMRPDKFDDKEREIDE